jgi:hypothetical protein
MPNATEELRAEWRDPEHGLDPRPALAYLRGYKVIPDANGYFHIGCSQYLNKKAWRAIDYLVQEWDYGWTWR